MDDDVSGLEIGIDLASLADGEVVIRQCDLSFDPPLNFQVLAAGDLSLEDQGCAERRGLGRGGGGCNLNRALFGFFSFQHDAAFFRKIVLIDYKMRVDICQTPGKT
jgi:hypothetical protein